MFAKINANESLQVLAYVCLPLLILLIAALIGRRLRRPRFVAVFPTFTLRIDVVGMEDALVNYRTDSMQTTFDATLGRGTNSERRHISVEVRTDMELESLSNVVRDLALGLDELRYQYAIYRKREPRQVMQEERDWAIKRLSEMGLDVKTLLNQGKVTQLPAPNGLSGNMDISEIHRLTCKAKGFEEQIEILESNEGSKHGL